MRISLAELAEYTSKLTAQQRAAQVYVETNLRTFYQLNPGVDLTTMREYAEQLMTMVYQQFGDQAAACACVEYDAVMQQLGFDVLPAEITSTVDTGTLHSSINYFLRSVQADEFDAFASQMASKAYDHVFRTANKTMVHNATRDYSKGVRYARIPTGNETCGFCLMLASRGFVYTSRYEAGDSGGRYNWYHNLCDCRVMPGDETTEVEGYDPDELYDRYLDARATVGKQQDGEDSDSYTDRIVNELNRRDAKWAWYGEASATTRADGANPLAKELGTAARLNAHGFTVRMNGAGKANATISGNQLWEFTQPTGTGSQTIYHQFENAAKKARRVVVDVSRLQAMDGWSASTVEEQAAKCLRYHYRDASGETVQFIECLLVGSDGYLRRFK